MITQNQILDAMVLASLDLTGTCQLARSLTLYRDRGEYNGTLQSAIDCLQQADYEVQS